MINEIIIVLHYISHALRGKYNIIFFLTKMSHKLKHHQTIVNNIIFLVVPLNQTQMNKWMLYFFSVVSSSWTIWFGQSMKLEIMGTSCYRMPRQVSLIFSYQTFLKVRYIEMHCWLFIYLYHVTLIFDMRMFRIAFKDHFHIC